MQMWRLAILFLFKSNGLLMYTFKMLLYTECFLTAQWADLESFLCLVVLLFICIFFIKSKFPSWKLRNRFKPEIAYRYMTMLRMLGLQMSANVVLVSPFLTWWTKIFSIISTTFRQMFLQIVFSHQHEAFWAFGSWMDPIGTFLDNLKFFHI